MRHHGETSSGHVDDSSTNFYKPKDGHLSSSIRRRFANKSTLVGACLLLVVIILVLIVILFYSEEHDKQTPYKAGFVQDLFKDKKETGMFFSPTPSSYLHSTETNIVKEMQDKTVSDVCRVWPKSIYTYKEAEKVYFQYNWTENRKIKYFDDDSKIIQRLQFQRKLKKHKSQKDRILQKTILILSNLDNDKNDIIKCSGNKEEQYCKFTTDKNELRTADAVIFREQDLNNIPQGDRSLHQIWIFNTLNPIGLNTSDIVKKTMFNVTGTYDFGSHIPMLPMYWNKTNNINHRRKAAKKTYTDKKVTLVVYNKNCEDEEEFFNKYKDIIKSLEKNKEEMNVEWFNYLDCSKNDFNITRKNDCFNRSSAKCYENLESLKKFALAFEISNIDYVSERFFHPLNNFIIPIAIGSNLSKYEAISPRNSFIYYCDYQADIEKLRKKLIKLNNNKTELEKYFSWQEEGEFLPASKWYCQVCFGVLH